MTLFPDIYVSLGLNQWWPYLLTHMCHLAWTNDDLISWHICVTWPEPKMTLFTDTYMRHLAWTNDDLIYWRIHVSLGLNQWWPYLLTYMRHLAWTNDDLINWHICVSWPEPMMTLFTDAYMCHLAWTNDDLIHWCIYVSLGLNQWWPYLLTHTCVSWPGWWHWHHSYHVTLRCCVHKLIAS